MDINWRCFICEAGTEQHSSVGVHGHAFRPRTCSDQSPRGQALHEGKLARLLHPVKFMNSPCQLQLMYLTRLSEHIAAMCTSKRIHVDILCTGCSREHITLLSLHKPWTLYSFGSMQEDTGRVCVSVALCQHYLPDKQRSHTVHRSCSNTELAPGARSPADSVSSVTGDPYFAQRPVL